MKKVVELTNVEQVVVKWLADQRYKSARAGGVTDAKMGPQSTENTDLEGLGAELAFCRLHNLYPDLTVGPRSGGVDCTIGTMKVDVKTTKYKTGKLLATLKKKDEVEVDIYALMIGEFPKYTLVGWAWKDDLIQDENIGDLGYGKGYILEQKQLNTTELTKRRMTV